MDNDDYLREAHNQIFNDEYYKILKGVLYSNAFRKLIQYKKVLLDGWLDERRGVSKTCWSFQTTPTMGDCHMSDALG